jgi:4-hydroxy-tetrahydrodipicolinate reductase
MNLRVCVAGATGWVGRPLCAAIAAAGDLDLVGAVSRSARGETIEGVAVAGSVAEALSVPTDVLVDYTHPDAVKGHALEAIARGVHVVVGASGLTAADYAEIDRAARDRRVGVIAGGNFSITAVLLERFACQAARYLDQWEIVDYAADTKPDAPSGTARELAFRLSEVRAPAPSIPPEATLGEPASRGAALNGSQVHSLRLPGFVISVEAIFGAADERLTLRHDAGSSAAPYIQGTLLAVRKAPGVVGLVRGLDKLLDKD